MCRSKIDIITVIFLITVLTAGGHYWWSLTGLPPAAPSSPLPIPINKRMNLQILLKMKRNLQLVTLCFCLKGIFTCIYLIKQFNSSIKRKKKIPTLRVKIQTTEQEEQKKKMGKMPGEMLLWFWHMGINGKNIQLTLFLIKTSSISCANFNSWESILLNLPKVVSACFM